MAEIDREKVIEILSRHKTMTFGDLLHDGIKFDLGDVVTLLKEQEPKPIAHTDNPYTGLPVARCPKCGKFARQFHAVADEETHFCPWCGQAVKWND